MSRESDGQEPLPGSTGNKNTLITDEIPTGWRYNGQQCNNCGLRLSEPTLSHRLRCLHNFLVTDKSRGSIVSESIH